MVTLFYNNCCESTNVANVETENETKSFTDYNNERNENTTIPLNTNQNTFCSIIAENLEKDKDKETNDDYDEGIPKEINDNDPDLIHVLIRGNSLLEYLYQTKITVKIAIATNIQSGPGHPASS